MSVSDSDDDYLDVGAADTIAASESASATNVEPSEKNGKKVRGKDIAWIEFKCFDTIAELNASDFYSELKKDFTKKFSREPEYADIEIYVCKFARRRGFVPCSLKYKLSFLSHCDTVLVESNLVHPRHSHVVDQEHCLSGSSFRWTPEQTQMIVQGVTNEAKPKVIRRNMDNANLFSDGKVPTSLELSNKIAHVRKQVYGSNQIFNTHQLREKINEYTEVPEEDNKAYIAASNVEDEKEDEEPRFNIIWTSKKLMKRISNDMIQDDATYRLLWQGNLVLTFSNYSFSCMFMCVGLGLLVSKYHCILYMGCCLASIILHGYFPE